MKKLRVFIGDPDIYTRLGGGQTVYRALIAQNPNIDFHLPTYHYESLSRNSVPKNVFHYLIRPSHSTIARTEDPKLGLLNKNLELALDWVAALGRVEVDLIDAPDYWIASGLLPEAFRRLQKRDIPLVLALHGTLSSTHRSNLEESRFDPASLDMLQALEQMQFEDAALRYGISKSYEREWSLKTSHFVHHIDPISVLPKPSLNARRSTPQKHISQNPTPSLVFAGRLEHRKGPDVAIELARLLKNPNDRIIRFIGSDCEGAFHQSQRETLTSYAKERGVRAEFLGQLPQAALHEHARNGCIGLFPSRFDTFNLVSLEFLLNGSPIVVGSGAGVLTELSERFRELPFLAVTPEAIHSEASRFQDYFDTYSSRRTRLLEALSQLDLQPLGASLGELYREALSTSHLVRKISRKTMIFPVTYRRDRFPGMIRYLKSRTTYPVLRKHLIRGSRLCFMRFKLLIQKSRYSKLVSDVLYCLRVPPLTNPKTLVLTPNACDRYRVGRTLIWKQLKKFAETTARPDHALAYSLRLWRYTQEKLFEKKALIENLRESGYPEEARIIQLLENKDHAGVTDYLRTRPTSCANPSMTGVTDRRSWGTNDHPQISIIVSLYNAETLLPNFLAHTRAWHAASSGRAEIIFVDSGSHTPALNLIDSAAQTGGSDLGTMTYLRTHQRETIQGAWNQGLKVARGEYVTFLGVDETLYPETLDFLADALDQNPDANWAMADSIVTEVDLRGSWKRDVMRYRRRSVDRSHLILDPMYLSYVGGLYRKSLHEQCGLYDPTFRAAGDTEFKNRALPWIRPVYVPETCGIFLNYPQERMTQHPRSEIEDLRAWLVFRTPGGLNYLFDGDLRLNALKRLYELTFNYRKSYRSETSSDLELRSSLEYLLFGEVSTQSKILRDHYLSLDQSTTRVSAIESYLGIRSASGNPAGVFNDHRYEHHVTLW